MICPMIFGWPSRFVTIIFNDVTRYEIPISDHRHQWSMHAFRNAKIRLCALKRKTINTRNHLLPFSKINAVAYDSRAHKSGCRLRVKYYLKRPPICHMVVKMFINTRILSQIIVEKNIVASKSD